MNQHAPCSTNGPEYCWRGGGEGGAEVKGAWEDVLNNALFPSKAGSGVSVFRVEVMLCQPLVSTPSEHARYWVGWGSRMGLSMSHVDFKKSSFTTRRK